MPNRARVPILVSIVSARSLQLSVTLLVWTFVVAALALPALSVPPSARGPLRPHEQVLAVREAQIAPATIAPALDATPTLASLTPLVLPVQRDVKLFALPLVLPPLSRTPVYLQKLVLLL